MMSCRAHSPGAGATRPFDSILRVPGGRTTPGTGGPALPGTAPPLAIPSPRRILSNARSARPHARRGMSPDEPEQIPAVEDPAPPPVEVVPEGTGRVRPDQAIGPRRAFVVDASASMQLISTTLLRIAGFTVESFGSPAEAVQRSIDLRPDLMVVEPRSPGVGAAVRGALRSTDTVGRAPDGSLVVLLPDVDEAGAAVVAARLTRAVAGVEQGARVVPVSRGPAEEPVELLERSLPEVTPRHG